MHLKLKKNKLFLTGDIKIGKSTVLKRILNDPYFNGKVVMGLKTVPILADWDVLGYQLSSLSGEKAMEFARVGDQGVEKFNKYSVDSAVFDMLGVELLSDAMAHADVIVIDEVGIMEKNASVFRNCLKRCLESERMMIGVFQRRAHWFLEIIKHRVDVRTLEITLENRGNAHLTVLNWLKNSNIEKIS